MVKASVRRTAKIFFRFIIKYLHVILSGRVNKILSARI